MLFHSTGLYLRKSYNVNCVNTTPYENLFDGSLGCCTGDPIKLTVDNDPTFHCDRKAPILHSNPNLRRLSITLNLTVLFVK